jgi:L-ascorbate metabolism protein UlaG (beta-lactamase superfamily)
MLEDRIRRAYIPEGATVYVPRFDFPTTEVKTWQTWSEGGLEVTAVPVRHVGWRYGADLVWMTRSFTGYVLRYHGLTVYYGGDTGYEAANFRAARERFPGIDLAILPIGPIAPRAVMEKTHEDPAEAIEAFLDLGARWMVPIHYDTFVNSTDQPGEAVEQLGRAMADHGLTRERVAVLAIGEQRVFVAR